ncbi:uncharacterized protein L201_007982 [Kwoniella dendrophila CBS 6074]|uniref:HD/PDEase domain-containing protein n=1 Tax=Kwoniella dendrophila CBS 6074 TaxID=1295534 RepID=A0AAX4K7G1_9TREE
MSDPYEIYGFTALPAAQSLIKPATDSPKEIKIEDLLPLPSSPLAKRINEYCKLKLSEDTYKHSIRVYLYGKAISKECFPQFNLTNNEKLDETWFLTALLHDIGTTDEHIHNTRLSYEFWAGFHALDILQNPSSTSSTNTSSNSVEKEQGVAIAIATKDQAESISEAIIRHQDIQNNGNITLITRLIHLGTLLDNIGSGSNLIHPSTIKNIIEKYSRPNWSNCFANTVKKEKQYKPYTMVSRIDGFQDKILENQKNGVTGKYDTAKL